jgi:hypothetical protein
VWYVYTPINIYIPLHMQYLLHKLDGEFNNDEEGIKGDKKEERLL